MALILLGSMFILRLMGQNWICPCCFVNEWYGKAGGPQTSQHLLDWYTFSHLIHGFLFYGLLSYYAPEMSLGKRLVLALVIEASWEIVENTPFVIDRYRELTAAVEYQGDSILNSCSDMISMVAGFGIAHRSRWGLIALLTVSFEAFTLYFAKDSLALNVLMLLYPLESVRAWQTGMVLIGVTLPAVLQGTSDNDASELRSH